MKIHEYCGIITDTIMKQSLKKCTVDNISCIFICFENFAKIIKQPSFIYKSNRRLITIKMKDNDIEIPHCDRKRLDDVCSGSDSEAFTRDLSLPPILTPQASDNINN